MQHQDVENDVEKTRRIHTYIRRGHAEYEARSRYKARRNI